jgi:peptide chain release factor 1
MLEKLKEVKKRFEFISEEISKPEIISDPENYKSLMREHKGLEPIIEKYSEYLKCESDMNGAAELMNDADADSEMRELAGEEYYSCKDTLSELYGELQVLLLPKDPDDDKNVIVEIRAGAGGEEAALFASVLYRMYSMYAQKSGLKAELLSVNETGLGGIKEVSFSMSGEGAYSRLKFESGVHRVQRVPETESSGRIHTSTATVAVLPEAEDVEVEINPADLEIETCKSSGAGGQHVNKTESAIRLIHKPTGIIVECQDERSQHKNREKAMKVLRSKLYDMKLRERNEKIAGERKSQVGTGDRSERIRTYNFPQGRVTDHRIGLTLHSIETFINGDIDDMITALINADTAEKLKGNGQ